MNKVQLAVEVVRDHLGEPPWVWLTIYGAFVMLVIVCQTIRKVPSLLPFNLASCITAGERQAYFGCTDSRVGYVVVVGVCLVSEDIT